MPIVTFILVVAAIGFILWLINAYVPMDPRFKTFLPIAAIVLLVIWFLSVSGILGTLGVVRI